MRTLAVTLISLLVAAPLAAQKAPKLPKEMDPNDWVSYYDYGMELINRHPDKAEKYFIYASKLEPSVAEPLVARYAAWWRKRPEMWKMWLKGDKMIQKDKGVRRTVGWLDQAKLLNPFVKTTVTIYAIPDDIAEYITAGNDNWDRGWYNFTQGKWRRAARAFSAWLKKHPNSWSARYMRGQAYVHLHQWTEAEADFTQLVNSIDKFRTKNMLVGDLRVPDLYYALGWMYRLSGEPDKAKEAFHKTFEEDLAFYLGHMHYANFLLQEGDTTQALAEYQQAVELNPKDEVLQYNYGTLLMNVGQPEEAVKHLETAIKLNKVYPLPYFNKALCHERLGETDQAKKMYSEFVVRAPGRYSQQIEAAKSRLGSSQ